MTSSSIIGEFHKALEEVLSMSIGSFVRMYRDVLPKFEIVHEDDTIEELFEYFVKDYSYLIVIDSRGKLRGSITYLDILTHLGIEDTHILSTPLASIGSTLRISRIPLETLSKMKVSMLIKNIPPHVHEDATVREALNMIERSGSHFVLAMTRDGAVIGVITAHAIFRAAMEKLKTMRQASSTSQQHPQSDQLSIL